MAFEVPGQGPPFSLLKTLPAEESSTTSQFIRHQTPRITTKPDLRPHITSVQSPMIDPSIKFTVYNTLGKAYETPLICLVPTHFLILLLLQITVTSMQCRLAPHAPSGSGALEKQILLEQETCRICEREFEDTESFLAPAIVMKLPTRIQLSLSSLVPSMWMMW